MPPPTNQELNNKKKENYISITPERKYYKVGNTFIKRSLRPNEWQKHNGYHYIPLFNPERVLNEGAVLKFLAENTNILLPNLHACFEDDGAVYLITEYVEGVSMHELDGEKRAVVEKELKTHVEAMHALKSNTWGGPTGLVLPPYRIMRHSNGRPWRMRERKTPNLVFCHNDLSQHNVLVDPATLKINAIIDWEYAGYYPPEFDVPFYKRVGPSVALEGEGEANDEDILTKILATERL